MKDTIYREDAIKAMRDTLVAAEIPYAVNALFKVPSADRPQGEWIEVDDYFIRCKCSICGWESHKYEDDVYGMPYCPNCGACMKGADDETAMS